MAVAEIEEASFYVDGEIDGVADAGLGRVHVAAKFGRDQRTAGLAIRGGNADASEERMHGNLHREVGVERLESCRVCRVIDVVEPYPLFQRWLKHGRVMRTVDRTETRGKGADAHVAVHLQIENLYSERVAGFCPLHVERSSKRIISPGHAERVAWFLKAVAEAVERVGVENISRLKPRHRLCRGEDVLHVVISSRVANHILRESRTSQQYDGKETKDHASLRSIADGQFPIGDCNR